MTFKTSRFQTALSVVFLLPLLAFTCFSGACGGPGTEGTRVSDDAASEASPERRFLSLGSAPAGGAFFVVGGALAEVLDQSGPEGWQVTSEATQGSQENIRRLVAGQLDLALSNAAITYHAVRGEGSFEEPSEVRSVMTLAPNVALFVTPANSGVRTIADLAGKRVVIGPAGAGFEMFVGELLEAHGLSFDDFTPLNDTQSGAVDQLSDGSAAAAFLGGAVPTASITQAATSMDLRFVPFDPTARQRLIDDFPFFHAATIPAGTYRNQEQPYDGLNVGSMHLITSVAADEEVIYQVTKTLYEQRAAVVERHPAGKSIQPGNVVRNTGTPFHPGAIRYYREIGIWPESPPQPAAESDPPPPAASGEEG